MRIIKVGEGGLSTISEALSFIYEERANAARRLSESPITPNNSAAEPTGTNSADCEAENPEPVEIQVGPGVYHEYLQILEPYITLSGAGPDKTVITGNLGGREILEDGIKRGTFRTQTAFVHTHDFTARDLTIENAAGPGCKVGQAIALYADGDRLYFENVHLKGYQDTLFTGPLPMKEVEPGGFRGPLEHAPRINGRQHYKNCRIEGTVDFIFGSATAYFEKCTLVSLDEYKVAACEATGNGDVLHVGDDTQEAGNGDALHAGDAAQAAGRPDAENTSDRKPLGELTSRVRGYVTAPSTPEGQRYGYVFADCDFIGNCPPETCYLGRPWREYAQVVLIRCHNGPHIRPEGWHDWNKELAHKTAFFAEYESVYDGRVEDPADGLRRYLRPEEVGEYDRDKVLTSDAE